VPLIAAGVVGIVFIGVIGWLLFGLLTRFDVTVNGDKVTLGRGSTVQTLLDRKVVSPTPGNLLAVDGKVLSKGDGAPCTAVIDGKEASIDTVLTAGNVVEITDGYDTTEEATKTEETIPAEEDEGDRSFEAYWFGSIHLLSDGEDGIKTVSTGTQSGKTVAEVTKEPINAGYRIYSASPDDKVIALTFDDGPWPDTTDEILDILEENGAKATFFTIGEQIASYKDEVKRAIDMGCKVYTHTYDHAAGSGGGTSIANMSASEQVEEIQKGYKAIKDATGEEPDHIMRAPGGNFYGDVIDNLWDYVDAEIGWDVDTMDWSRPGVEYIEEMILSAKPGQVVLMHDGGGDRSQTVEALANALPKLVEDGYKFITIDELLEYGMPSSTASIPTTKSLDEDDTDEDSAEDSADSDEDSESDTDTDSDTDSDTNSDTDSEEELAA
jgi:peptidoglycan/xylan/chitin deacetylase (PgdA/CDA1 family)